MPYIRKVGIVGQGHVGAHVANSLLLQGLADELYLCDVNAQKLTSEAQDLRDSLSFCPRNCKIVEVGDDYEALSSSTRRVTCRPRPTIATASCL